MSPLRQCSQVCSKRERRRIVERARQIAMENMPRWAEFENRTEANAYLASKVEYELQLRREFGGPLLTWFAFWMMGKVIDWAIERWLERQETEETNGHA